MRVDRPSTPEENWQREEVLRPNRFLGYNRNTLAVHLFEKGAYAIAESELRRAIWLNPYEPAFMANLAWCLFRQKRFGEAWDRAEEVKARDPNNPQIMELIDRINEEVDKQLDQHDGVNADGV
jgi:predicted Zn-dependent protease